MSNPILEIIAADIGFRKEDPVFRNISAAVSDGDVIALLGVNGIGKSTLLRTLNGMQPPLKGNVLLEGLPLVVLPARLRARNISVVSTERIQVENITVREMVALGRAPYTGWFGNMSELDLHLVDEAIKQAELADLEHRPFNYLSDGEKQRVMIARAICQSTALMILDEPTAYLDFRHKKLIYRLMSELPGQGLETAVIFSTHDVDAALQYANTFWLMKEDKTFEVVKKSQPGYEIFIKNKLYID